ncbi:AarF/ABC1/UbiB kinase family protein [Haloferax sp. MBLA0076]|uniref:AarF/ABC1/UbiB kinase family protein n=1 Tax=Haloferax litoreum TaxID=2666140 RepID=A0A6A8GL74_9EURY|nr:MULTISPECIES: AarF/ABC1/UbiB kinase family protein [Haloferax]KAB1189894.1 AarF/ABC1/UbiB kinase family protein [Haloferax sp. CBA1148]MRX23659.1 AarF/ABC1/UbiB kinase family protein [Haloferax litoreum]
MLQYPRRFVQIALSFLPFFVAFLRDHRRFVLVGRPRVVTEEQHRERARKLRDTMVDLGPTFIKIGQVLSTRPDIVPLVYAQELITLQDTVPPGPFDEIRKIVAADIGLDSFDEFDPDALAGGSLAQVHEARYDGRRVAVKVRRPNVVDIIDVDLRVVRRLLPLVIAIAPRRHHFSLRNLADDFERVIKEELDFDREGRMMDEIGANFADVDDVKIPTLYSEASSERVLTMEYVESTKITDVDELRNAGFDPAEIAHEIADAYFKMGIVDGVFHADPHPGNLGVDSRRRIVFYDFGMTGTFTPEMQDAVVNLYLAAAARDTEQMMDVLIDLGVLDRSVDRSSMNQVLELAIENLEGRGISDWRTLMLEVNDILHEFPFRIPPNVMLLIRVGTVSEGVLRQLDPEFDILSAAQEFLAAHGYRERGAETWFHGVRDDATMSARSSVRLPAKLERVLDTVQRGELEVEGLQLQQPLVATGRVLAYALITASWVVGSAILTDVRPIFGAVGWTIAFVMTVVFIFALHNARSRE